MTVAALALTILLSAAPATAPTAADVAQLEEWRVLEPLATPTRTGGSFVEFAPTIETRNVVCEPAGKAEFSCRFETRIKEMIGEFGPWTERAETVVPGKKGGWRFR